MTEEKTPPPAAPSRRSALDVRREREAEALRANLRRRKERQRARDECRPADVEPTTDDTHPEC